ncbi:hypothetical protein RCL1_004230 [Eukaryota sp. TZLM3-RCL]
MKSFLICVLVFINTVACSLRDELVGLNAKLIMLRELFETNSLDHMLMQSAASQCLQTASKLTGKSFHSQQELSDFIDVKFNLFLRLSRSVSVLNFVQLVASILFLAFFGRILINIIIAPLFRLIVRFIRKFSFLGVILLRAFNAVKLIVFIAYKKHPNSVALTSHFLLFVFSTLISHTSHYEINLALIVFVSLLHGVLSGVLSSASQSLGFVFSSVFTFWYTIQLNSPLIGVLCCLYVASALGFVCHAFGMGFLIGFDNKESVKFATFTTLAVLLLRCSLYFIPSFTTKYQDILALFNVGIFHVINFVFCIALLINSASSKFSLEKFLLTVFLYSIFIVFGIFFDNSPLIAYPSVFVCLYLVEVVLVSLHFSPLAMSIACFLVVGACVVGKTIIKNKM